ncbi:hypothetical protein VPHF89G1_0045 [Vibrio phage F89 g1]
MINVTDSECIHTRQDSILYILAAHITGRLFVNLCLPQPH